MSEQSPEPFNPSVPLETVRGLIHLARDLQGKTGSTLFDDEAGDPDELELDILEDRGQDPAEIEFRTLIDDLPEDAQADLVALAWLGRDDGDWSELRRLAAERREIPTSMYLRSMPLLAENLADGLAAIESAAQQAEDTSP
jgi:hypothetical protein